MNGYSTNGSVKVQSLSGSCLPNDTDYDDDAESYFTRAGITDILEKNTVNTFVLGLKSNSLWARCLTLYPHSPTSVGAMVHNLKSSSFTKTSTAFPTYAQTGNTGDGVAQFLDTGVIPATHFTSATSHTIWYYSRTNSTSGIDIGCITSATQSLTCRSRTAGNVSDYRAYGNTSNLTGATTDSSGYFFYTTSDSNSRSIRRNNASVGVDDATNIPGTRPTHSLYVHARNNAGTLDTPSTRELCGDGAFDGALTNDECDTFYTLISTLNANIISGGR